MPRRDTRLESEGAEFLVLGTLLIEKAYKTYTRMPGYDLLATNPEGNSATRIQVKSRWRRGANAFPLTNFDCDFVVFVALNRRASSPASSGEAEQYVFPIALMKRIHTPDWVGTGERYCSETSPTKTAIETTEISFAKRSNYRLELS